MGEIGVILLYMLGEELAEKGVEYIIDTVVGDDETSAGTVIRWGTDEDGDGEWDEPFEIFVPDEAETVVEKSIIIMSQDGTMTVYDENGNITAEDCDTAYSLWVSENGIMNKPLDNYTVTEGLLLIAGVVLAFGFIAKLFRRRKVM